VRRPIWIFKYVNRASYMTLILTRKQYTVGLATGVPVQFITVGNSDFVQALLDTSTYLSSTPNPPSVLTTSYGDDESSYSLSDAQFVFALQHPPALTTARHQECLRRLHGTWCSRHLG
jgi:hypothetical protein